MIDSKPVQPPYLSLVPYKSFGKLNPGTGSQDGDLIKNKNSKVKWNRLLGQDLETLLKEKVGHHPIFHNNNQHKSIKHNKKVHNDKKVANGND